MFLLNLTDFIIIVITDYYYKIIKIKKISINDIVICNYN